ncbi:threonine dehydratase [Peptoclostridium litorale DSM 5388]|uniref:L-threonine dehydratase catabolic TdcB n=1 Tax=Peptoclostridium litorale DSM 5388 TaxID=1121324 RepID=A0A069RP60_PEPLI|nr:threonine ammonia-lyase [Peptoclostridium litorale]KDR95962.1 L-threonine dehydratase catabolic TdcB [Peptoclostridium litorale DSM 5388]SIO09128.1 threonine dehydratase [Peptoclostridium litorale DSM 5388]
MTSSTFFSNSDLGIHVTLEDMRMAQNRISSVLENTNLIKSRPLSEEYNCNVFLKPENLQTTGAFKIRGAFNKISQLSYEEKKKGLVASSAGNHAQGVAYAAQMLGVESTIVMPRTTPLIKVESTRGYGANVVLCGDCYDDAYAEAKRLERENGFTFIHPFDDMDVITGQGTIGLEIVDQLEDIDYIVAPIGGGGLISGIALAAKFLKPSVKIIGVEPEGAKSMKTSVEGGRLASLPKVSTVADGVAVKTPGEKTFSIVQSLVDEIVTVSDFELMESFLLLLEKHKIVAENAGILPVAALKKIRAKGKNVACVISGGNIDVVTVSSMINRGLVSRSRIFCFAVQLPDTPGELSKISDILTKQNANVIKLDHNQFKSFDRLSQVNLEVTVETSGKHHVDSIVSALEKNGYRITKIH